MIAEIYIGKPKKKEKVEPLNAYIKYKDFKSIQKELENIEGVESTRPLIIDAGVCSWDAGYEIIGNFDPANAFQTICKNGYSIFHSKITPDQIRN